MPSQQADNKKVTIRIKKIILAPELYIFTLIFVNIFHATK